MIAPWALHSVLLPVAVLVCSGRLSTCDVGANVLSNHLRVGDARRKVSLHHKIRSATSQCVSGRVRCFRFGAPWEEIIFVNFEINSKSSSGGAVMCFLIVISYRSSELRTHCSTVINKCSSSTCRNGELCCLDPILNPVCIPIRRKFPKCSHSLGTQSTVKCLTNVNGCARFSCPDGHSCCVDECNEPQCREDPVRVSSYEHESLEYRRPTRRIPVRQRITTTALPEHPHDDVEEMSSSLEYNGDSVHVVTKLHRRKTTTMPIAVPVIHRVPYPHVILPMRGLLTGLLGALPPLPRYQKPVESSDPRAPEALYMPPGGGLKPLSGSLTGNVPTTMEKLPAVIREP